MWYSPAYLKKGMPQVKMKACCVHETEMTAESTQYPESSLDKEEKEKRGSELGCVKKL